MKILTLRDPWTYAIFELGKNIENRVWSSTYRGPVLIHRGKGMKRDEYESAARFIKSACGHSMPTFEMYRASTTFGVVVGHARIVDCRANDPILDAEGEAAHPWRMRGQFGFQLEDIKPDPIEVPWKGERGLRDIDYPAFRRAATEAIDKMMKARAEEQRTAAT